MSAIKRNLWTILIISLVGTITVLVVMFLTSKPLEVPINNLKYERSIDSLNHLIDSLQLDTSKIDSSTRKIDTLYVKFKQEYIDRINANFKSDVIFWADYLSKNNQRLLNSNYSDSIKVN